MAKREEITFEDSEPQVTEVEPSPTVDMSFRQVPRSLRNAYKAQCSLDGVTMTEQLIRMFRNYVRFGKAKKKGQNGQ